MPDTFSPSSYLPKTPYSSRPLRAYESIWKQLRSKASKQEVVLEIADERLLGRIKKAIIKEKDMDMGFKVMNEIESWRLSFEWKKQEKKLVVKLVSKYGIVEVVS